MIVIEFNDSRVTVFKDRERHAASPGFVTCDRRDVVVGEASLRRSKIDPTLTESFFWQLLSQDQLQRPSKHARHQSDLAYLHLDHLWQSAGLGRREDAILVVPGDMTRPQLALLLGIADRVGIGVRAVADIGIAAAAHAAPGRGLWHLDVHLHRAVLTELIQGPQLERGAVHVSPEFGLMRVYDAWAHKVAALFVAATRFDPLHQAEVEQSLYDQLESWSEVLETQAEAALALEHGGKRFEATLAQRDLESAASPLLDRLAEFVEERLPTGRNRMLISHHAAGIAGLGDRLADGLQLEVEVLPESAAANGVTELLMERSQSSGVPYILRRPWFSRTELDHHSERLKSAVRVSPTHMLIAGVARPLTDHMGLVLDPEEGVLVDPQASAGTLRKNDDDWHIDFPLNQPVKVNGRNVEPGASVNAGDRVRIGLGSTEFMLIRVTDGS